LGRVIAAQTKILGGGVNLVQSGGGKEGNELKTFNSGEKNRREKNSKAKQKQIKRATRRAPRMGSVSLHRSKKDGKGGVQTPASKEEHFGGEVSQKEKQQLLSAKSSGPHSRGERKGVKNEKGLVFRREHHTGLQQNGRGKKIQFNVLTTPGGPWSKPSENERWERVP